MLFDERERERVRGLCTIYWKEMRGGCRGLVMYEHALQQIMRPPAGKRNACLLEVMVV